jgi:hypothetical protein
MKLFSFQALIFKLKAEISIFLTQVFPIIECLSLLNRLFLLRHQASNLNFSTELNSPILKKKPSLG